MIKLNDLQLKAIQLITDTDLNICVTGGPGTGKSKIINSLEGDYYKLAPTNLAASNFQYGGTIHSFLLLNEYLVKVTNDLGDIVFQHTGIPPFKHSCRDFCDCKLPAEPKSYPDMPDFEKIIIIDEFSMVPRNLLKAFMKFNRVILFGDLNQLPPINAMSFTEEDLKEYNFEVIKLQINYRAQEDLTKRIFEMALTDPRKVFDIVPKYTELLTVDSPIILCFRNAKCAAMSKLKKGVQTKYIITKGRFLLQTDDQPYECMPGVIVNVVKWDYGLWSLKTNKVEYTGTNYTVDAKIYHIDGIYEHGEIFKSCKLLKIAEIFMNSYKYVCRQLGGRKYTKLSEETMIKLLPFSALTVHKAQGQTFNTIIVNESDLRYGLGFPYGKKLVYTALTRGKKIYKL